MKGTTTRLIKIFDIYHNRLHQIKKETGLPICVQVNDAIKQYIKKQPGENETKH